MKRIYAFEERCLNCRLCEVACKTAHSVSGDTYKAYMFEDALPGRVHVEGDNMLSVAVNILTKRTKNPQMSQQQIALRPNLVVRHTT